MGNGQTKEEQLYNAVQSGNQIQVKALHREGASLEFVDKEGRTPFILACTRGDLFDMVILLLSLGANANVYRPGAHGGFPLHHAAKRGLDKTVMLLLRHGADPLAINDDSLTPLDMARHREHVTVVRIIEDKICLFSGMVREISGPGFLEVLVPQLITKKVWVVVVPAETPDLRRPPKFDLVVYQAPKVSLWNGVNSTPSSHPAGPCNVAVPKQVIHLSNCDVENPKLNAVAPVLIVTERTTKQRHKFMPEFEGDKGQLEKFWMACKGIAQARVAAASPRPPSPAGASLPVSPSPRTQSPRNYVERQPMPWPLPAPVKSPGPSPASKVPSTPSTPRVPIEEMSEDDIYAMAIDASIRTASNEGIPVSPSARRQSGDSSGWGETGESSYNGWGTSEQKRGNTVKKSSLGGWDDEQQSQYNGWGSVEAGPSRSSSGDCMPQIIPKPDAPKPPNLDSPSIMPSPVTSPSAPPLPDYGGPIHYPSIDTSPVQLDFSRAVDKAASPAVAPAETSKPRKAAEEDKATGRCVVCWEAPAHVVCVPCGHLAGCMKCLSEIKEKSWGCPVCRAEIQQLVRVFQV